MTLRHKTRLPLMGKVSKTAIRKEPRTTPRLVRTTAFPLAVVPRLGMILHSNKAQLVPNSNHRNLSVCNIILTKTYSFKWGSFALYCDISRTVGTGRFTSKTQCNNTLHVVKVRRSNTEAVHSVHKTHAQFGDAN